MDGVTIAAGQRIDLVIEALSNPIRDYSFVSQMSDSNQQMNGIISYGGNYSQPQTFSPSSSSSFDDFNLVPSDNEGLYGPVDHYIEMNVSYSMSSQGPRYVSVRRFKVSLLIEMLQYWSWPGAIR